MAGVSRSYFVLAASLICLVQFHEVTGQLPPNMQPCTPNPCADDECRQLFVGAFGIVCVCEGSVLVAELCEIDSEPVCGTNPAAPLASPRYFGGTDAPLGKWPWQGYITFTRGSEMGATLISPQWAVTSGGNVDVMSTRSAVYSVVFGDVEQGGNGSDYRQEAIVEEIIAYPGMNLRIGDSDPMLLRFAEPLEITDYVRPICLPEAGIDETAVYDMCYTTGWGLNENGEYNQYLKEGRAGIIELEECQSIFESIRGRVLPTENMICAEQADTSEGPCVGDGGNALVCYRDGLWEMAGIQSWGYQCGGELPFVSWRGSAFSDLLSAIVFEDRDKPEVCEPIELEECSDLPYEEAYLNQQDQVVYAMNFYINIGRKSDYCDVEELQSVLCAVNLHQCNPSEEGELVICKAYCEDIQERCDLTRTTMCVDLPYAPRSNYSQKWCYRGLDHSCGDTDIYLTEENTTQHIVSPLYPYNYPELRDCLWNISAPEGYVIQIKYRHLNVYPDSDYVTYGEGDPYLQTSILERFDGDQAPPIWRSSSNEMWVRFESNRGETDVGFALYASAIPATGRECEPTDILCDNECYPYHIQCDFVYDCTDGRDELGCDEVSLLTEPYAIIESPLHPIPGYPANFNYTWNIEAPEGYRVGLEFLDFDLDYDGKDYLLIGESIDGVEGEPLYHLSANSNPSRILPLSSNVWIQLITDDNRGRGRGFVVNATQEPDEPAECDKYEEFDCGDGLCLHYDVQCDGVEQCYDGSDEDDCLPEVCEDGREIPLAELCNQQYFCYYGEDEEVCPLAQLGDKFYFEVPMDPYIPYNYVSNATLAWIVRAEEGLGFALEFLEFSIEPYFDNLYFGSTPEDDEALEDVTGRLPQQPRFIDNNTFFAVFESDENKNTGGVLLGVEVVDLQDVRTCEKGTYLHSSQICDGLWNCPDGRDEVECDPLPRWANVSVATPGFPLPYENNARVTWTFEAEEGLRILFYPYFFNTEDDYDTLRIGSGSECEDNYSSELTGYPDPEVAIISEDNTMCLFFSSDETVTAQGIFGGIVVAGEEDFVQCPEDGSIVFILQICDTFWECPETGADEVNCPPLPSGEVYPLTSPDFPAPYPPNARRIETASREEGFDWVVEFNSFDLENGVDFVTFGCGANPDDPSGTVVANLTGYQIPDPFIVECPAVWVLFESDGQGDNYGYSGYVSIVDPDNLFYCPEGGSLVAPTQICNWIWNCPTGADESDCPLLPEGVYPLYSPNHPSVYPPNTTRIITASRVEGTVAVIEFDAFDLGDGDDSLTIGCGSDPYDESSVIATLTGSEIPAPVILECLSSWERFQSDGEGRNYGFSGTITVLNATGVDCMNPPLNGSPEEICEFAETCNRYNPTCTPIGDAETLVSSPNYPEEYDNNLMAISVFAAPLGYNAVFNITDFSTEENDTLTIRTHMGGVIAVLTGEDVELPYTVRSPGRVLEVIFETDNDEADRGYSGYVYAALDCDNPPIEGSQEEICELSQRCYGDLDLTCTPIVEPPVPVYSRNYPDRYEDDQKAISIFVAPLGYLPVLNLTDFATEDPFDTLTIQTPLGVIDVLTGNDLELPYAVTSPLRLLQLIFETDGAVVDRGYNGTISLVAIEDVTICEDGSVPPNEAVCNYVWDCEEGRDEEGCDPVALGSTFTLTSPGYPEEDYENDLNLVYTFTGENMTRFVVNVTDLDTEYLFDILKIGYGDDPSNPMTLLYTLSGTDRPEDLIYTPENELWVSFTSDDSFNLRGFSLDVYNVEVEMFNCSDGSTILATSVCDYQVDCYGGEDERDCDPLYEGEYTIICNPESGDTYEPNTNVTYLLRAEEGLLLLVNFTSFMTEFRFDSLAVGNGYDPSDPDSLIDKVSGFAPPGDIVTEYDTLWMRFTTDGGVNYAGFCANISAGNIEDFNMCYNGEVIPPSEECNYVWFCEQGVDELGYNVQCPKLGLASLRNFSSPDFPYPYPPYTNLTWTFVADPELTFNASVTDFDAGNGSLTFGYGVDPSDRNTQLVEITKDTALNETYISTPGNELWARFEAEDSDLGFFANLYTVLPGQSEELCGRYSYFPCYNGGNCTVDPDNNPEYYFCVCPPFYTGRYCETHFCDANEGKGECDNGGECVGANGTYCTCPDIYFGDFCEFEESFLCDDISSIGVSGVCDYELECPGGEDESGCDVLEEGDYTIICNTYYEANENVTYLVRAEEGLVLLVNFTYFATEPISDVVTVGDGDDPSDPYSQLLNASGTAIPRDVVTYGNAVWLRFVSDGNVNDDGFCANISARDVGDFNTCDNDDVIPPSEECNYVWYCENGVDEYGGDVECPTLGLASLRNFSSPGYPYQYPGYANVTWTYVTSPNLTINVSVTSFNTLDGSLTIGSGVDPYDPESELVVITKSEGEREIAVPSNQLWARYETELDFGFFAELYTVMPGQDEELCGYFPCYNDGNCTVDPDYDPEYYFCECPRFYTGRYCETHFCDANDGRGECQNRGTCIGEGDVYCACPPGYGGEFCSEVQTVVCPENGEVAEWSKVCDTFWDCPETGYDESDCPVLGLGVFTLTSPNYPDPYPDNTRTVETGTRMEGLVLTVEFHEFDLAEGDFLRIGCGFDPRDPSSAVATLTGNEIPETVVIEECLTVYVQFESNGVGSGNGYNATLRTGRCAGVLPYSLFRVEPLVSPLLLDLLGRERVSQLLLSGCALESIQRAACFLLYPPADEGSYPYALCSGTCNNLGSCPVINALRFSVDCTVYAGYDQMVPGNPGLCMMPGN